MTCKQCSNEITDEMKACGFCYNCGAQISYEQDSTQSTEKQNTGNIRLKLERAAKIGAITITTGFNIEGYSITKYIDVISAEVVIGTGVFTEVAASVADVFGENSTMLACKISTIKEQCKKALLEKAYNAGANAIIGVDFGYIPFAKNMIGVSMSGTAVNIEKQDDKRGNPNGDTLL